MNTTAALNWKTTLVLCWSQKNSPLFFFILSFLFVCFVRDCCCLNQKRQKSLFVLATHKKKQTRRIEKNAKRTLLLLLPSSSSSSSSFFCRPVKKKKERGFRIWKNNLKNDFTRPHLEKKRVLSYEHNKELFFFFHRGILSPEFVARFCRKRRSALPLSCSLCLSLCLSPSRALSFREKKPFERRRRKRRRRGVDCFPFW